MNIRESLFGRLSGRARTAVAAVVAALALLAGGAWYAVDALASAPSARTAAAAAPAPASAVVAAAPDPQQPAAGRRDSYADVVKVVAPAVVTIRVEGKERATPTDFQGDDFFRRFFGDPSDTPGRGGQTPRAPRMRGMGSGVIVSPDGYILTNNHVIDNADSIRVEMTDGRSYTARVVGADAPTDLALLKIDASGLRPLALGNSDAVSVGDVVLAVGNPLGVGQTVTMGIISAKGRSTSVGDGSYEDFLQTDAPINHGNSGGALVDVRGELIGINSQILSTSDGNIGIGFAIPANMARRVMEQLRTTGKVTRAQLGVTVQQVTEDMAQSLGLKEAGGAIVSAVTPGSAAAHAGIRQGDVITAFNGEPVRDSNGLRNEVAASTPGSNATLTVIRDGREQSLGVKLDEAAPRMSARGESRDGGTKDTVALGIAVTPLTPELARRLDLDGEAKGLVVQQVDPDGRAADAGLRPGDVIEQANRAPVDSVDALRAAVQRSGDRPVLLLIRRDGTSLFVTVDPAA
ncbi:MAG: DegQ family serine endoprotease [Acidobacteria bacterium]|nr:DegQ family serine endoprotease [Acidobacteriota bacterium]